MVLGLLLVSETLGCVCGFWWGFVWDIFWNVVGYGWFATIFLKREFELEVFRFICGISNFPMSYSWPYVWTLGDLGVHNLTLVTIEFEQEFR